MTALSSEALQTLQNFNASVARAATPAPSVASLPSSASAMQQQPVRTLASAASTVGDSSYTPDLSPQQAAYQRAHALLKQQFGLSACGMTVRDDDLLLDSGATFHFSGRRDNVRPLEKPVEIWAATGPVVLTEGTTLHNSQLPAPLDACYTEGAPDAAALGRLIRQYKLNFSWNYDDFEHPLLVDSGGKEFMVRVEADCPILSGVVLYPIAPLYAYMLCRGQSYEQK